MADLGLASASDNEILDYAARVGAVIVTKDEDFAILQGFFFTIACCPDLAETYDPTHPSTGLKGEKFR